MSEEIESPKYPEHEKARPIIPFSQKIGQFVDWLRDEKEIFLYKDDVCVNNELQKLLHEFFEIDYWKLQDEKEQMLEEQRKLNEANGVD